MMQRRQFEFIAYVLRLGMKNAQNGEERLSALKICYLFANKLRATNPSFDRERFLKACGIDDEVRNFYQKNEDQLCLPSASNAL